MTDIHLHPELEDVVARNSSRLVQVQKVSVNGAESTRDEFLKRQVDALFEETTLQAHLHTLDRVAKSISSLNYGGVKAELDLAPGFDITSRALDLSTVFTLTDPQFYSFALNSFTTSHDPLFTAIGRINNLFGGGERLLVKAFTSSPSQTFARGINLAVESPVANSPLYNVGLSGFWNNDVLGHSSHSRDIQGTAAYVYRQFGSTRAEVGVEAATRSIHSLKNSASDSVRVDAGETLRALLYLDTSYNSLDTDHYHPTRGIRANVRANLAGMSNLGDVSFNSVQATTSNYYSLDKLHRLVVNLSGSAGVIDNKATITDRLFTPRVYGYEPNGIGPKDCQDAIGGQALISAAASVYGKLPRLFAVNSGLRWKMSFNGGSLVDTVDSEKLTGNFSTGCGLGLSYQTPVASMEVMYVAPLASHSNDVTKKGLQFSVGLQLL